MTSALEFLQTVLPNQGIYCLAKPNKSKGYSHQTFETIDDLAKAAKYLSDSEVDIFFAVGSLKEPKVWNEEKQKHQVRTHANMSHFRSLFVDLDCGETKDFKNQGEAIESLKSFCQRSGFPKPTYIVNSGRGVHCYWAFDVSILADDWSELADKFKTIHKHFKFPADPPITSDKSRVLRVPGTFNWKQPDNPRPVKVLLKGDVYSLETIRDSINSIIETNNIQIRQPKAELPDPIKELFKQHASNLEQVSEKDVEIIYQQCPQMAYIREVGGPVGYALRCSAASIIKFTKQQDYSVLWANDDKEETVRAQTEMMIEDSITDNPHTCERFESENNEGCNGCSHKGKVKSPIVLGTRLKSMYDQPEVNKNNAETEESKPSVAEVQVLEQTTEEPTEKPQETKNRLIEVNGQTYFLLEPPIPYTHTPNGSVMCMHKDDSGEYAPLVVSKNMIAVVEICESIGKRNGAAFKMYVDKGINGKFIYEFPMVILSSNDLFRKALYSNNIPVGNVSEKSTHLLTYMNSYIQYLQNAVKSSEIYSHLGWDSDEFEQFVTPNGRFTSKGEYIPSGVSESIMNPVKPMTKKKGTLEAWRSVIDVYAQTGYEDYAFGHLVAYGSLLFPFTGFDGALVSMVGKTGSGKSTVLKTINSVYGHPKNYLTQQDTINAKMNRLGIYNNYAVTYDEITNMQPEELSQYVYSITQGRSKLKLGQDQQEIQLENCTWQMIMACTSNSNLADKLSSFKQDASAEIKRIFEFYIHVRNDLSNREAREIFDKLDENYGHAGDIFIREMVARSADVKALYKEIAAKVDEALESKQDERYWVAVIASCVTGGIIARKLGLHNFDMNRVFDWAIIQAKNMRGVVIDNVKTPHSLLVEFLNSNIDKTIVMGGGTTEKGKYQPFYALYEPNSNLVCRLERDNNRMFIDRSKFKEWVTNGKSDYDEAKRQLTKDKIVLHTDTNKVLTAGSQKSKTGNSRCWVVDLTHSMMAGTALTLVSEARKLEGDKSA